MDQNNTRSTTLILADTIEKTAWSDILAAAPASLGCVALPVPGTDGTLLLTPAVPAPVLNRVVGLSPAAPPPDTLDWIQRQYAAAGIADFWISAWDEPSPTALKQQLDTQGWEPDEHEVFAKFLFDLEAALPAPAAGSALHVRPVRADEQALAGAIICRSFGLPEVMVPWMGALADRPGWQMFFACDENGEPIAAGSWFRHGDRAWLGVGVTLPEQRERGAQQLLLAARLAAAKAAGCVVAGIETEASVHGENRHSLNNIRRAGFREVGLRLNYLPPVTRT